MKSLLCWLEGLLIGLVSDKSFLFWLPVAPLSCNTYQLTFSNSFVVVWFLVSECVILLQQLLDTDILVESLVLFVKRVMGEVH